METGIKCACNRSLAAVCAFFAGLAVALYLAGDACLDGGGRLSDTAWTCEGPSGAVSQLWGLFTPGIVAVAALAGAAVYFAVNVIGRRWLFRYGVPRG
jgi:hypothetical protein